MNPILQMLKQSPGRQQDDLLSRLMSAGNPNRLYQDLMSNNEQFRNFVNQNQGKSPEQIAQEYGLNLNPILNLLRK